MAQDDPKLNFTGLNSDLAARWQAGDPDSLACLGTICSRIMGKFATGSPPFKIAHNIGPREVLVVLPFVLKG